MRYLFLVVFFFVHSSSLSQELELKNYCSLSLGSGGECLELLVGGFFEYSSSGCQGYQSSGKGSYTEKKNSVKLFFDYQDPVKKGYFKIYDEHESLDSSKIEFQFFDEWGDPFYGVNLLEFKNEKVVNGWASDSEGKLVLKRDNSSEDFDFEAQFIGMDFQRIEISFDQNKYKCNFSSKF